LAEERLRLQGFQRFGSYWRQAHTSSAAGPALHRMGSHRMYRTSEREITGAEAALPIPSVWASGLELKAYEDRLDAVVLCLGRKCALWRGLAIPQRRLTPRPFGYRQVPEQPPVRAGGQRHPYRALPDKSRLQEMDLAPGHPWSTHGPRGQAWGKPVGGAFWGRLRLGVRVDQGQSNPAYFV